ncbi:MAG: glycoside hydrolase family 52 protein, partial [Fibrobacterota bacterium]
NVRVIAPERVTVDQAFFEAKFFPWITREILDLFADRHSFMDELKLPGETRIHQGGLSFCHDMGVRNRFSPTGHSSYEIPDLEGCFSHMTFEQACNWPLTGAVHLAGSKDKNWCIGRRTTLEGILESLERREHPDPTKRTGVPGTDSVRCGSGTEITTYDSLDPSLAQTRQNLYTTVKLWAAYLALEKLLSAAKSDSLAARAREGAKRSAKAVVAWPEHDGIMPAIADGRNASTILPSVEGLVYPLFWNDKAAVSCNGPFGVMISKLGRHLGRALDDGICRFPDGGWRISSTSDNSWLSKIWIAQTVAERVFGRMPDSVADHAHAGWLSPGSSRWGWSDQIIGGQAIGSKFYPRGVTSILFLLEP